MRISDMNWMQVEEYLQHDDRAVLPLGSTEQHSYLRLTVDCILPERVAARRRRAAGHAGVSGAGLRRHAVLPGVPRIDLAARRDAPARGARHPRRHGAQRLPAHPDRATATAATAPCSSSRRSGPPIIPAAACSSTTGGTRRSTWAKVQAIDPVGVARLVDGELPVDAPPGRRAARRRSGRWSTWHACARSTRSALRAYLGDGNYGGVYQRSDEEMLALWQVAVEETRALLDGHVGQRVVRRRRCRVRSSGAPARSAARWARTCARAGARGDAGRHRRRARRGDQSRRPRASPGLSTTFTARMPAFTPDTAARHVGHHRPGHQGAPHRGRRARAAAAPGGRRAAWSRRRTGSTNWPSPRWSARRARSARS